MAHVHKPCAPRSGYPAARERCVAGVPRSATPDVIIAVPQARSAMYRLLRITLQSLIHNRERLGDLYVKCP
jgi:hypothetical protein